MADRLPPEPPPVEATVRTAQPLVLEGPGTTQTRVQAFEPGSVAAAWLRNHFEDARRNTFQ